MAPKLSLAEQKKKLKEKADDKLYQQKLIEDAIKHGEEEDKKRADLWA